MTEGPGHALLAGLVLVPFLLGAATAPVDRSRVVFSFQDNDITESSGLAVVDGLVVTANDSGDTGRVFAVDPATGQTVGTTGWREDPEDVEALAPAGDGSVWVADIGDNTEHRDSIEIARVPVQRGEGATDVTAHELRYPDGPHDAETLMRDPATNRLYVATKGALGGTLYEVPKAGDGELRPVGDVLPLATDGAFFPDGRFFVVRNYAVAAVYAVPSLELVGSFELPSQPQGEGIAVDDRGRLLLGSEGLHADVLRVALPDDIRAAMAGPSASPSTTPSTSQSASPTTTPQPDGEQRTTTTQTQRSVWPWFLSGLVGLGIVAVVVRSLRRR